MGSIAERATIVLVMPEGENVIADATDRGRFNEPWQVENYAEHFTNLCRQYGIVA